MATHCPDPTEYPFTSRYFQVNGEQLHYIDEGKGDTLLFVHGTPSWSFDFRNVIKALSKTYRCIAIDHIGFGLSSKPAQYDYTTQAHSRTLEQFVLAQQLENITLVVHDFGGPIGLSFAMRHPERISRIVVFNSWLWSSVHDPGFIRFSKILKNPLLPFLYRYLNFSPRFVMPASFGAHKLSRRLIKQYTRPFANPSQRYGPLAFARSLLHDQDWFELLWSQKEAIVSKPALFAWGMKDPVIGPAYLDKFAAGFAPAITLRLKNSGHFPQEEEPEAVAVSIHAFIRQTSTKDHC